MSTPDLSAYTMVPAQMDADALAAFNEEVTRKNEERARAKLAASNRAKNIRAPKVGDTLFVAPARGIKARGRAGLRFTEDARTRVLVVKDGEELEPAKPGEPVRVVTTVNGAEQILGDDSLVVFQSAADAGKEAELRSELTAREREIKLMGEELARLRADARRNAKDSDDGSPARLKAAAAAAEKAGAAADKAPKKDSGGLEP